MEEMSKHIVISLILLLSLLFFLLLSNRIYTNRRIRLRNLQLQENSLRPSSLYSTHNPAPAGTTPLGWHRIPGTLAPSPTGNSLRFTPSPQGQGDVVVNIPIGVQFWNGRDFLSRAQTSQNSDTYRGWGDDTPSVWGIDLGRRGARGGLRSGAAVLVPPPGSIVVASTAGAVSVRGGRSVVQENVGMEEEEEGLPRYEEPPPGYEKVLAEGGTEVAATPGEPAEGSHGRAVGRGTDPVQDFPTPPEPAVTRERPAT